MEYQRDEHRVHLVVFHLVWVTKRRKPVLDEEVGGVGQECRSLIEGVCQENDWTILELAVQPDHIHLFVRVWPSTPATDVLRACKGRTSRILRERYPHLRRLPSLWTRSYFCATAGNVSSDTIEGYIAAQKGL
jgi:putative transposase